MKTRILSILFLCLHLSCMCQERVATAIIGGGISGCYAGWRLIEKQSNVALFEMSDRIGGRLYSVNLPGLPNVVAELGGMRFLESHAMVMGLSRHLQLPIVDFVQEEANNLFYLRNKHFRNKDLKDPAQVPYNLTYQERGKTPSELLIYAFQLLIPNITHLDISETFKLVRNWHLNGHDLYNYGYWNLLDRALSREAYMFITDAGGYSENYRNWNALVGIDTFLSAFYSTKYFTIETGYQQIPLTLARQFQNKGGKLFTGHHLTGIDWNKSQGFTLTFETEAGKKTIYADKVILAIPAVALSKLASENPVLNQKSFTEDIASVTPIPMSKIFFGYDYPWWCALNLKHGRSVTDLEIRQTYYFGVENETKNGNPKNLNSLLLASYHDVQYYDYWNAMQTPPYFKGNSNEFVPQNTPSVVLGIGDPIPQEMVDNIHLQLKELHDVEYIPTPYTGAYKDWGKYPFGGASYRWKNGIDVVDVMVRIRHPLEQLPLYTCGESFCDISGWVEGALNNTELMLEEYFGLARPSWFSASYDLGPTREIVAKEKKRGRN